VTAESRNSGAKARCPLLGNGSEIMFALQRIATNESLPRSSTRTLGIQTCVLFSSAVLDYDMYLYDTHREGTLLAHPLHMLPQTKHIYIWKLLISGILCRYLFTNSATILPSIRPSVRPSVHPSIHPSTHPSTHPPIHPSMALQPLVGPRPLFSYSILHTVGTTPWAENEPITRPLSTHRATETE
jgi:hypothetical protein